MTTICNDEYPVDMMYVYCELEKGHLDEYHKSTSQTDSVAEVIIKWRYFIK